jgi:hypothetical protein
VVIIPAIPNPELSISPFPPVQLRSEIRIPKSAINIPPPAGGDNFTMPIDDLNLTRIFDPLCHNSAENEQKRLTP